MAAEIKALMAQYNDGLRDGFELAVYFLENLVEPNKGTPYYDGLVESVATLKKAQDSQEVLKKKA